MADAVAIGEWQQTGCTVSDVLDALGRLRAAGERTATRTSVVTLVAVAREDEEKQLACDTTETLGGRHPGRTIVVRAREDGAPGLDARVRLVEGTASGVHVWSEDVSLDVRGPAARHLDSVIEPLTLPDLPLACWYVASAPEPDDRLADAADVVLVDSKELGDADCFEDLLPLFRRRTLIDLSWVRLTPWRLLLAGLFEGRTYRPYARQVEWAGVEGKPGVRHLLGGWLLSRLGLHTVHLEDERHARVRLVAGAAEFVVERRDGERLVRASARVQSGPGHEELLPLPDTTLAWSLAEALSDLESDVVYGEALEAALSFAG